MNKLNQNIFLRHYVLFILIIILNILGVSYYSIAQNYYEESHFFSSYQDIPIMQGLTEQKELSFSFDKPEGDITEIIAKMNGIEKEQVIYFYQVILPQFGWGRVNDTSFFRKNEFLEISFEKNKDEEVMKMMIYPSL